MSDARALLRATKQSLNSSSRAGPATAAGTITDRFASYNTQTGALRCSACQYLTIKHEALWSAHVSSKSHRANAAALIKKEAEEAAAAAKDARAQEEEARPAALTSSTSIGKRKAQDGQGEGDEEQNSGTTNGAADAKKARTATGDPALEEEWQRFQQEVLSTTDGGNTDVYRLHAAATISAEPVLIKPLAAEDDEDIAGEAETEVSKTQQEIEEEQRRQKEAEEKEEILERVEEEVRIQQESDERCVQ